MFFRKQKKLSYFDVLNQIDRKSMDYGLGMYGLLIGDSCLNSEEQQLSRAFLAYYIAEFPTKIIDQMWYGRWKIHIVEDDYENGYLFDKWTKQIAVNKKHLLSYSPVMINVFSEFFYKWHESLNVKIQDMGGFQEAFKQEKEKLEFDLRKSSINELEFFQGIYGLYKTEKGRFEKEYPSSTLFLDYFLYYFVYEEKSFKR